MTTYLLSGQERTTVALRVLHVTVTVEGPACPVGLGAWLGAASGSGGHRDTTAITPRPDLLILPRVGERSVIRVTPLGDAPFPDGTRVGLTLRTESGGDGGDEVIVATVEVSGRTHRDLAAVEAVGPRIAVSALDAVPEAPIGRLQAAARAAARSVLGVDRVPDAATETIVLAVDVSASMAPALAEGSVEAVVDVVTGVAMVTGRAQEVRVCLLGQQPEWLPAVPVRDLGAATAHRMVRFGFECGFRSSPAVLGNVGGALVYVVTDGVPADRAELEIHRDARHLVSIGAAGDPRDAPLTTSVPCTAFPAPPPGRRASDELLGSSHRLAGLVSSLVGDRFSGDLG